VTEYLTRTGATQVKTIPGTLYYNNSKVEDKFDVHEILGKGGFGVVRRATYKGFKQTSYALKYIDTDKLNEIDLEDQLKEENALSKIHHDRVVKLHAVFAEKGTRILVLDLAPGGDLYELVDKAAGFSAEKARPIFEQIVEGIRFIHFKGIIHRDCNPKNFMLDNEGNVKICDFGLCHIYPFAGFYSYSRKCTTLTLNLTVGVPLFVEGLCMGGCLSYRAPEMVMGEPHSYPLDVWAIGSVLYWMLTGK